ncbi:MULTISPECIES: hypothetical protein [unclassified Streptomyces]|uniref:hypothetical protein n=1 Tax=unclassified Streptomyces TaxID=2593676 RepID=UPI0036694B45
MNEEHRARPSRTDRPPAHRVRLPGFVKEDDIGLGEFVKRATRSLGIRPCGDCEERARRMNEWLTFSRRHGGAD